MRLLEKTFQDARIDLRDGLEPIYANYVVARFSKYRFALDFVQIMPRATVHRVKARISMTPQDARLLAGTLGAEQVVIRREQSSRAAWREEDLGQAGADLHNGDAGLSHLPGSGAGGQKAAGRTLKPTVSLPCNLAATTSNVVIVSSTPAETVLEFALAAPGYYSVTVLARIVLSSAGVRVLQEALKGGLSAHASEHVSECDRYGLELVPGLRTPATWGGCLPFALN